MDDVIVELFVAGWMAWWALVVLGWVVFFSQVVPWVLSGFDRRAWDDDRITRFLAMPIFGCLSWVYLEISADGESPVTRVLGVLLALGVGWRVLALAWRILLWCLAPAPVAEEPVYRNPEAPVYYPPASSEPIELERIYPPLRPPL